MILTKPRSSRRSPPLKTSANQTAKVSSSPQVALYRCSGKPRASDGWTAGKRRGLLRFFLFPSAIHRRQRFWTRERLDLGTETASGYEINLGKLSDMVFLYSTNADPSQASHSNGQNGIKQVFDALK